MKFSFILIFNLFCFIFGATTIKADEYRLRHEYKFSFKGPGMSKGIPFWNFNGDVVVGDDQVRLAPSLRNKSGGVWSKNTFTSENWRVEVELRIHGRSKIGADGMAIWFVEQPNIRGPVFGSMDMWKGLGIFLDSYDNDQMQNNPLISIIINNGSKSYTHHLDGSDMMIGGCSRDFRNRLFPSKLRLTYWKKTLRVELHPGNSKDANFEPCAVVEDLEIAPGKYFGVSAATGGLADDHDVIKFTTFSLQDTEKSVEEQKSSKEEEEEYQSKIKEFRDEAKKFREDHPDRARREVNYVDSVEQSESPELRAISDVQNEIKSLVSSSIKKMEDLIKNQQDTSQKSSSLPLDYSTKSDIQTVLESLKLTINSLNDLKSSVTSITNQNLGLNSSIEQLGNKLATFSKPSTSTSPISNEDQKKTQQQLDYIASLVLDVQAKQRKPQDLKCPPPPPTSCLSVSVFLLVVLIQITIFITYQVIKTSRDASAKKFY